MSQPLAVKYRLGTHRLVPPEETLARLLPHLQDVGITRCADVTHLDVDLGAPVYIALRPRGRVLQSSAGKGLTATDAKVSALMEAVELDVAERPDPARLRWASRAELLAEGARVDPLPSWIAAAGRFFGDRFQIPWVRAEDLLNGGEVWLPAGAAYFCEPTPCRTSTNGLASGNHLVEATLHALYEVIERDALSRLLEGDELVIAGRCQVIDPGAVTDPALRTVIEKIERAATKIVLLEVPSPVGLPVFSAVLLNRQPFAGVSALNLGHGAHLDGTVALSRALCEAVQSRLTMIHGARDDIANKPVRSAGSIAHDALSTPAYRFFDALEPSAWAGTTSAGGDLDTVLPTVLARLRNAGHERVYRVDMGCPLPGLSVVKVIAPSLLHRGELL